MEQGSSEITEPRLLRAVQNELGKQVVKLMTPPVTSESTGFQASPFDDTANVGVPVAPFPRWLLCPSCRLLAPIQSDLFELKVDPFRKDWNRYVHRGRKDCHKAIHLYELGASGEVADIQAQCDCGQKRRMSDAFGPGGQQQLPSCRGRWPHWRK